MELFLEEFQIICTRKQKKPQRLFSLLCLLEQHTCKAGERTSPSGVIAGGDNYLRTLQGNIFITYFKDLNDVVNSVAISPDGQTLASGSDDRTIKLWNLKTGDLLHNLTEHKGGVTSVAISPDGQTLASGSTDRTIKLWKKK